MSFPTQYKALTTNHYSHGNYSLVPIRYQDRNDIRHFRNAQIYHLRQAKLLTEQQQNDYFSTVVAALFEQAQPPQILFSYLKHNQCIGYGGLVHISWQHKKAEISFIMQPELETQQFNLHWVNYLTMLYRYAFEDLKLHKIYTYAFDLRAHLYPALELGGLNLEARLKEHYYAGDKYIDVLIHSKFIHQLSIRLASVEDLAITYAWASNPQIRKFSFNKHHINPAEHQLWFSNQLTAPNCRYFIVTLHAQPIGSIRFAITNAQVAQLSYLIDPSFQGHGYSLPALDLAFKQLSAEFNHLKIVAEVEPGNLASQKIFAKLNFRLLTDGPQHYRYLKEI